MKLLIIFGFLSLTVTTTNICAEVLEYFDNFNGTLYITNRTSLPKDIHPFSNVDFKIIMPKGFKAEEHKRAFLLIVDLPINKDIECSFSEKEIELKINNTFPVHALKVGKSGIITDKIHSQASRTVIAIPFSITKLIENTSAAAFRFFYENNCREPTIWEVPPNILNEWKQLIKTTSQELYPEKRYPKKP